MRLELEFSGELIYWKGPAPWFFVAVPEEECEELAAAAPLVSYGWGVIPATARAGETEWTTSLFPTPELLATDPPARVTCQQFREIR